MLNIVSPINQLGYGIAWLNLCKELDKIDPIALWPIGHPEVTNVDDRKVVIEMLENAKMPDFRADCIRIWHQHDMSQFVGHGLKVGFPIFELDNFNQIEKHHLGHLDKIFVCSEWARQVVVSNLPHTPNDVHVIPLGVNQKIFNEKSVDKEEKSGTIFFNCGKWEVRKGHDILIKAFEQAFTKDDDVELWMMCQNPFNTEEEENRWISLYKNSPLGEKITIINRVESQEEVYNIMANADCGVFPSRAEGWNLELLEMMACGKPVITTDYSAHTEFCTKENSFLVTIDKTYPAADGKWFDGKTGEWAFIGTNQIEQISEHMRFIHENKPDNPSGLETAKEYSWKNSAKKIMKELNV